MRLIDAEALKNAIANCTLTRLMNDEFDGIIMEMIDNAPTVEAFTKDYVAGAYNEGYMCGNKEAEKARPQGEWIIIKDEKYGDNVKCPFCGKEIAGSELYFCCKCGAKLIDSEKMKGGAE